MAAFEAEGARLALFLASLRLGEGDIDVAINQAETAVKLMKELQAKKKEESWSD